jgi:hypothetical protein
LDGGKTVTGWLDISRDDTVVNVRRGRSTSTYPMSLVKAVRWG